MPGYTKTIESYLVNHVSDYILTGSTRFFGEGADKDYVVNFSTLPDNIIEELKGITPYAQDRYPDAFINVKSGDYDFIIIKSVAEYYTWCNATLAMVGLCSNPDNKKKLKDDKIERVQIFEHFKISC